MSVTPPPPQDDGRLLEQAREKLRQPEPKERYGLALAAAAFFAICAMGFALAAVLAPPLTHEPAARTGVR